MSSPFTIGVEEEYHLVDAATGGLRADAPTVVEAARRRLGDDVDPELLQTQVEIGTPVCESLGQVRDELVRMRRDVVAAAREAGCLVVASGTYPGEFEHPPVSGGERYGKMGELFGILAREQTVCGCHVHVAIEDRELAMAVLRRSRPWLPALLALSTNSPYWQGQDTSYASYRSQVWSRWPTAGPPAPFRSRAEYDEVVASMLATGVLRDEGMLYWLVRASHRYDTLEYRMADVCLSVDEAVLVAALVRALARTCAREEESGRRVEDVREEPLRAAYWRAGRFGVRGELVDPTAGRPAPAADVVARLLEHVRPALEEHGDAEEVSALVARVLREGSGAERQRTAYAGGGVQGVISRLAEETAGG